MIPAELLRPIHGGVRAGTCLLIGLSKRDADADRGHERCVPNRDRFGGRQAEFVSQRNRILQILHALKDYQQLIAANACAQIIGAAQTAPDTVRHDPQDLVTRGMAVAVVDAFEIVQIAKQYGDCLTGARIFAP